MLNVTLDFNERLDHLDESIQAAVLNKMVSLTNLAYEKVVENLSGKVLQTKTGELVGSVRQEVTDTGSTVVGQVFIDPTTPKARALEEGGKGYYVIVPTKAQILRFVGKSGDVVFAHIVNHPPSQAFGYMRLAAEEMVPLVAEGLQEVIQDVMDGRL